MDYSYLEQAANPRTPPDVLRQIAYDHPDARSTVAANPSAYPELIAWIASFQGAGGAAAGDVGVPGVDGAGAAPGTRAGGSPNRAEFAATTQTQLGATELGSPKAFVSTGPTPLDSTAPTWVGEPPPDRRRGPRLAVLIPVFAAGAIGLGVGAYFAVSALTDRPAPAAAPTTTASQLTSSPAGSAPSSTPPFTAAPTTQPTPDEDIGGSAATPSLPADEQSAPLAAAGAGAAGPIGADGVYRDAVLTDGYGDGSQTWHALADAAASASEIRLELAVHVPEDGFGDILGDGSAWIGAAAASADPDTRYTTAGGMGYWIVVPRGQLLEGGPDKAFVRIAGTYRVNRVNTERLEEFHLTRVSATTAAFPAGPSDPDRCDTESALARTRTDIVQAANAIVDPARYDAEKARWMSSPRIWWAIKMTASGQGSGALETACRPWLP